MILSKQDIRQLESIGKSRETLEHEFMLLTDGVSPIKLDRGCSLNDGITVLSREQQSESVESFKKAMAGGRAAKFIAASGAASRMFQSPLVCFQNGWITDDILAGNADRGDGDAAACLELLRNLPKFAFFHPLKNLMALKGGDLESLIKKGEYESILENLLTPRGLAYSTLPKGLIPFHSYPDGIRTAFEEHLVESVGYLKDRDNLARIHFTLARDHQKKVRKHLKSAPSRLPCSDTRFNITYSVQRVSTDTVVLDQDGQPLRDDEGRLVLRPSGHGALLENLTSLGGDIVFIKTIDNVLPDRVQEAVSFQKRVLGGYLISLQEELFGCLQSLFSGNLDEAGLEKVKQFARLKLNLRWPGEFDQTPLQEQGRILFHRLNAPLRICGMVKDPGYPGGRPFWIRDENGWESLQIVEPAQVERESGEQDSIWKSCEYFNPVDIVCGLRSYIGQPFDLAGFGDSDSGFISDKTYQGRKCRILEFPGLWNGSMARWNTVFIEVPAFTLRPVKTVLDLLIEQYKS